jgi:hypothetical protein
VSERQDHGMSLVLPFVVVESKGGPYADEPFVAGYQAGEIDARLAQAELIGADVVRVAMVRRALLPQLELHGMRYGFNVLEPTEPHHEEAGSDYWCDLIFRRES